MKKPEIISEGPNHTAAAIGPLGAIGEYEVLHKVTGQPVRGKLFLKGYTGSTGTEISFQELPAHTELPYFHTHRKNEETYVVLKGSGDFQIDGDVFPVREGSVVRIAPAGKRAFRNTSGDPMLMLVIQSREGSLEEYSTGDGERVAWETKWK